MSRISATRLTCRFNSRSSDFTRRKKFVKLVEDCKAFGADSVIFSSLHESGERQYLPFFFPPLCFSSDEALISELNNLSGIAAILTYPLDIETVEEEERQDKEDAEKAAQESVEQS